MKCLQFQELNSSAIITFSRPDALNALNHQTFEELILLLEQIEQMPSIRTVILTGSGKAFIAGADISEMADKGPQEARLFSKRGQQILERIEHMPIPFIGAINGFALGGGLEMALACDFLLATEDAKFGAPEVNLGLIPGFAGTQRLSRAIGINNARYYLYTAKTFDAVRAKEMGLVQSIVKKEQLLDEALKTAALIGQKGPEAVTSLNAVVQSGLHKGFNKGCATETDVFASLFVKDGQAHEGMQAFLEKRQPNWNITN